MNSVIKDIEKLKKENKGLLNGINKATSSLNKGSALSAIQQEIQFEIIRNATAQLKANYEQIRNLQDFQKRMKKRRKKRYLDLSQLTVPQIQNFEGRTVKRPRNERKTTAAQRRKTGNRVRL